MRLFGLFNVKDINEGMQEYRAAGGAVLLDVRTREEYAAGYIEGSRCLPLQEIEKAEELVRDKGTPLFVHCQSGARSARAAEMLKRMGYTGVRDIGGITGYNGKVVTE